MLTYAADKLDLVDEVAFVVVELLKEPFAPEAVLVEEEHEVFEVDFVFGYANCQVVIDEMQDKHLLVGN